MKKIINVFLKLVSSLVLGIMLISNMCPIFSSAATEFYKDCYVDSNTWSSVVSSRKSTKDSANIYAVLSVTEMYKTNAQKENCGVAENYVNLYGKMCDSNGANAIANIHHGASLADNGGFLMTKDVKAVLKFTTACSKKNTPIQIYEMGHTPSLDCLAEGRWNVDKKDPDANT